MFIFQKTFFQKIVFQKIFKNHFFTIRQKPQKRGFRGFFLIKKPTPKRNQPLSGRVTFPENGRRGFRFQVGPPLLLLFTADP